MKKIPNWIIIIFVIALVIASKFIFFAKKEDSASPAKGKNKGPVAVNYFVVKSTVFNNDVFANEGSSGLASFLYFGRVRR